MRDSEKRWTYRVSRDRDLIWFFRGDIFLYGHAPRPLLKRAIEAVDNVAHKLTLQGENARDYYALIVATRDRIDLCLLPPSEVEQLMESHGERIEQAMARIAHENTLDR